MDLYISSGRHSFTDHDSRIHACEAALTQPDVVFVEAPTQSITLTRRLQLFCYAPLLLAVEVLWISALLRGSRLLFGDDSQIDQHLVREHGAELIHVDIPHLVLINDNRWLWAAVNWLAIGWPVWIFSGTSLLSLQYLSCLLFQGLILLVGYLAATHSFRNQYIAREISHHAKTFTEGCLVTGQEHHEGVAHELADATDVSVLNPCQNES